jgi:hypothetical protein
VAVDIDPLDMDGSRGGGEHVGQETDGGGLPRPVRPQEAEDLSLLHRETDIIYRG